MWWTEDVDAAPLPLHLADKPHVPQKHESETPGGGSQTNGWTAARKWDLPCMMSSAPRPPPPPSAAHSQTAILKLFGGPWLGLDGPNGHHVGPHGCSSTRIVTK